MNVPPSPPQAPPYPPPRLSTGGEAARRESVPAGGGRGWRVLEWERKGIGKALSGYVAVLSP